MASSHRLPLPRFAERSCVCVSIGCYFLHVVLCCFLQTRTVVFSKLEIQPNGVDEGQCYPSFNWLAATSVVSYPSKFGIFQRIFLLGFYFTAGILFISLTMLEMMISLIKDIFFSSLLVRKLQVKFVRYFKQNIAPVLFNIRHLQQSARAVQYFEQNFSAQLFVPHLELSASQFGDTPLACTWSSQPHQCFDWYLRHFSDYIVKQLKNAKDNPPERTLCLQRLLLSS